MSACKHALSVLLVVVLCFVRAAFGAPHITSAAFAPDGTHVVVGSQNGIDVLSWPELRSTKRLPTRLAHVHDLAFSPTGEALAAVGGTPGEAGEIEVYSWPSGEAIEHRKLHDDLIYRIAWRADGKSKATASADQTVCVVGDDRQYLKGHSRGVLAVAFLAGDELLVSAGIDHSLRIWLASDGKLQRTLDNHKGEVYSLASRPRVEGLPMIASASADRTVRLWQPTIGRLVRFANLTSAPLDIEWTPNGGQLVASCVDGHLRVIDPDTVQIIADIPAIDGWAYTLAIALDGKHAFVGGANGQMRAVSLGS